MSELVLVDETLWVWNQSTGIPIYDYDFRSSFPCRVPWDRPDEVTAIGRVGAFGDYDNIYADLLLENIRLIHTPEQHRRASELSGWYPRIEGMTPRSQVYAVPPTAEEVADSFAFPLFLKGSRQTSRHRKSLSIVTSVNELKKALRAYAHDPILGWQPLVVRKFVPLRLVEDPFDDRIPSSFEFRTLWWQGSLVGAGPYWWEGKRYDWNPTERQQGLALAEQAARCVDVPFLVIDLAMTVQGDWTIMECNDAQESGYAGVSAMGLWQAVLDRLPRDRR